MPVPRHDLPALQRGPDIFLDCLVRGVLPDLFLHLAKPDQHLLVGKPVQGSSEAVKGCTVCQEGIRESRADEFACVCRDVATFVVAETECTLERK